VRIFAKYIEDRWSIPFDAAVTLCSHYEKGSSIYFLSEYVPVVSICGFETICEVYKFLDLQKKLEPLRVQARRALKNAEKYDETAEDNITFSISKTEIDDIAAAFKINSQSKGRLAAASRLTPLADLFCGDFKDSIEKEAQKYVDAQKGLNCVEDVIDGVTAILTDRFGFDENIRILVRDLTASDGSIEVIPKKKSAKYEKFSGMRDFTSFCDEDILFLKNAEENKEIKFGVCVPTLSVLELLKHNFLTHPESSSAQVINRAISDACGKFLSPMAQNSIKEEIFERAAENVSRNVSLKIRDLLRQKMKSANKYALIISQNCETAIYVMVVDSGGTLLRASSEVVRHYGKPFNSGKIKNISEQFRPDEFVLVENSQYAEFMNQVVEMTLNSFQNKPKLTKISSNKKVSPILKNDFVKRQIKDFDKNIQNVYATGICAIAPLALICETECLQTVLQNSAVEYLPDETVKDIVNKNLKLLQLEQGIEIGEKYDDLFLELGVSQEILENMRSAKKNGMLKSKNDIKNVKGIAKNLFDNIAGFTIFPKSANILDKTLIHPEMFDVADAVCGVLKTTIEDMISDVKKIGDFHSNNPVNEFFVREKIANQIKIAAKYISFSGIGNRSRISWAEIIPGNFTYGRVRSITEFGIFVDINAATDGLVHISEVPEYLSHSLDEIIHPGDKFLFKILDADSKRRRISLSMKYSQREVPKLNGYFAEQA